MWCRGHALCAQSRKAAVTAVTSLHTTGAGAVRCSEVPNGSLYSGYPKSSLLPKDTLTPYYLHNCIWSHSPQFSNWGYYAKVSVFVREMSSTEDLWLILKIQEKVALEARPTGHGVRFPWNSTVWTHLWVPGYASHKLLTHNSVWGPCPWLLCL